MDAILSIFGIFGFIALATAITLIYSAGLWRKKARAYVAQASDLALQGRFDEARHAVQIAIRLNRALQRNPDAVSLYRIILSRSTDGQASEIDRIRRSTEEWPKSRWEVIFDNESFRIASIVLWILVLLSRLVSL